MGEQITPEKIEEINNHLLVEIAGKIFEIFEETNVTEEMKAEVRAKLADEKHSSLYEKDPNTTCGLALLFTLLSNETKHIIKWRTE